MYAKRNIFFLLIRLFTLLSCNRAHHKRVSCSIFVYYCAIACICNCELAFYILILRYTLDIEYHQEYASHAKYNSQGSSCSCTFRLYLGQCYVTYIGYSLCLYALVLIGRRPPFSLFSCLHTLIWCVFCIYFLINLFFSTEYIFAYVLHSTVSN